MTTAMPAFAQDDSDTEYFASRDADEPLRKGAYVPFANSPAADGALVETFTYYDSAADRVSLDASAQVPLVNRVQLRAALDYHDRSTAPAISGQFDVLDEQASSIDLRAAAGWDQQGVNGVSAVFGQAAVGRTFASNIYGFGSARLDVGTGGDEVGMRLTAAAVRPLGNSLIGGIDSKLDVDLAQDAEEPANESTWSLHVGPVIGYSNELVAITASVGLATDEPRATGDTSVGAYAGAGLGLAL